MYWETVARDTIRVVFVVAFSLVLANALSIPAQAQVGIKAQSLRSEAHSAGAHPAATAQNSFNLDIETVLYSFCSQGGVYCTDGIQPQAGLIKDDSGNLYGTTYGGGITNSSDCEIGYCGYGTVFKLAPSGIGYTKTVLYNFCSQPNCTDGANPFSSLIVDAAGNFFGTTTKGGANDRGTVFKLTPTANGYTESVLYNFCSESQGGAACTDGTNPQGSLIEDSFGNLYGTTWLGGTGVTLVNGAYSYGTVFKLTPSGSGYNYTVLYSFCPASSTGLCLDGAAPLGPLIEDASGNFYGTTGLGGTGTHALECSGIGCGTVFKLTPTGSGYVETVLYSFCSQGGSNCTDGAYPYVAGLIEDSSGNLFGTTEAGGVNTCDTPGCGTVFELSPSGSGYTETVIHSFNYTDGANPAAGLIEDASGNLYGTTSNGGTGLSWECAGCGSGTVFELSPNGNGYTETVLYNFCSLGGTQCTDGGVPFAGVIEDASGNFYGTTRFGGANGINWGSVFKLSPSPPGFVVSGSPTSLTIVAGQSGTATLAVTPKGGFNSTVSFACSGLPAESSCIFNPQTVTPIAGNSVTTTLTITTTASTSAAVRTTERRLTAYALLLPGVVLGLVGAALGKRRERGLRFLSLLMPLGLALTLLSCGGSSSNTSKASGGNNGGNPGTPGGTSTITVTASAAGGTSQTFNLTVIVTK